MKHKLPPDDISNWYLVSVKQEFNSSMLVETWLVHNIENDYYVKFLTSWDTRATQTKKKIYQIYFKSQEDAVLFALRWS